MRVIVFDNRGYWIIRLSLLCHILNFLGTWYKLYMKIVYSPEFRMTESLLSPCATLRSTPVTFWTSLQVREASKKCFFSCPATKPSSLMVSIFWVTFFAASLMVHLLEEKKKFMTENTFDFSTGIYIMQNTMEGGKRWKMVAGEKKIINKELKEKN